MSTNAKTDNDLIGEAAGVDLAGGLRSEPGGRTEQPAGGAAGELPQEVRERLSDGVIDELLAGARTEEEIIGPGGVLAQLTKRLVERALSAELSEHLGYEPHQEPPGGVGNTRNDSTPKTLLTEHGPVPIQTPRDRNGAFEPQLVRKRQRRFQGFDDKILALYSRGLSTRDIEAHLKEIYGGKVGRDLISRVTDAVVEDVREWQARPLEDVYPVIFLDALVLKVREGGTVQRRACYLALGVTVEGERDVLDHAQAALDAFDDKWGERFPVITQAWRSAWEHVTPFLAFPDEVRRVIYTTNAIEALNRQLRKAIKTKGSLPQRGGRPQADLPRNRQRRARLDTDAQLDDRATRLQDPLRRPTARVTRLHGKSDALIDEISGDEVMIADWARPVRTVWNEQARRYEAPMVEWRPANEVLGR